MIGSAVGCFFVGLFGIRSTALGAAGLIGFISLPVKFYLPFFLALALSIVVAFVGTLVYGKRVMTPDDDPVATETTAAANAVADGTVMAPVSGTVESLKQVDDQVFASEMMGKGAAIVPTDDGIYAPVSGVITVAYPTKHAYGLLADDGAEVLIHLGIDTVKLDGQHFETSVTQGQHVTAGDPLGRFDVAAIKQAGYDPTVMVVVTNTTTYASVDRIDVTDVTHGDHVVALTKPVQSAGIATANS